MGPGGVAQIEHDSVVSGHRGAPWKRASSRALGVELPLGLERQALALGPAVLPGAVPGDTDHRPADLLRARANTPLWRDGQSADAVRRRDRQPNGRLQSRLDDAVRGSLPRIRACVQPVGELAIAHFPYIQLEWIPPDPGDLVERSADRGVFFHGQRAAHRWSL